MGTHLIIKEYKFGFLGCTKDIVSSDHSPVFASFDVPIISQFVDSPGKLYSADIYVSRTL